MFDVLALAGGSKLYCLSPTAGLFAAATSSCTDFQSPLDSLSTCVRCSAVVCAIATITILTFGCGLGSIMGELTADRNITQPTVVPSSQMPVCDPA